VHVFAEASVHAHDLFVNEGDQRHMVKAIIELLPERDFVPSLDFVKEPINTRDGLTFVVSSQNDDLGWISDLESEQETNNFATLFSAVYVVTHE
jgi:hypothetical protein